jgi:hypothetical protein
MEGCVRARACKRATRDVSTPACDDGYAAECESVVYFCHLNVTLVEQMSVTNDIFADW